MNPSQKIPLIPSLLPLFSPLQSSVRNLPLKPTARTATPARSYSPMRATRAHSSPEDLSATPARPASRYRSAFPAHSAADSSAYPERSVETSSASPEPPASSVRHAPAPTPRWPPTKLAPSPARPHKRHASRPPDPPRYAAPSETNRASSYPNLHPIPPPRNRWRVTGLPTLLPPPSVPP